MTVTLPSSVTSQLAAGCVPQAATDVIPMLGYSIYYTWFLYQDLRLGFSTSPPAAAKMLWSLLSRGQAGLGWVDGGLTLLTGPGRELYPPPLPSLLILFITLSSLLLSSCHHSVEYHAVDFV